MHTATQRDGEAEVSGQQVEGLFAPGVLRMHAQPIVRIDDGAITGYEALARFDASPKLPPDRWLEHAARHGRRDDLELLCMSAAGTLGEPPNGGALFVNIGQSLLVHPLALEMRPRMPERLVLELSEHDVVEDYATVRSALAVWKALGVGIAVDDVGSGWSSLRHVVQLRPDYIKLDRSLVSGAHEDASRRALITAMVAFARESGCTVIAEGVELSAELEVLREASVPYVQGYLLARPGPAWPPAANPALAAGNDPVANAVRGVALAERLAETTNARDACDLVAEHLWRGRLHMPSVYLQRGGLLRCLAQRGLWQVLDGMPSGVGVTGQAFALGETVRVDDVRSSPHYLEAIPGVVAEICVPVVAGGEPVGCLNVDSYVPLDPELEHAVDRAARALGRRLEVVGTSEAESANQRLSRHVTALAEMTDRAALEQRILDAAINVSGLSSAALVRLEGAGRLRVACVSGELGHRFARLPVRELSELRELVASVMSCYSVGDPTGAGFAGIDCLRATGARTVVVARMMARGRPLGVLLVADPQPASVSGDEVERMELLATHAAACLDNLATLESLRDQARRDALTGLRNHSAFRESLDDLVRSATADLPLSLVLCDLDRFKLVNDRFGHLVGDEVLRSAATALRGVIRDTDGPYRVGGDEFAVILPGVAAVRARDVARRLRRAGARVLAPYGAGLSTGMAELRPGESATDLIRRADLHLYRSKSSATRSAARRAELPDPARS